MSNFNPDKLSVELRDGVTYTEPIIHRRYTLTHSDQTADLFLTIGLQFASDKINSMRDEVLGEWMLMNGCPVYQVYVFVDGQLGDVGIATIRNEVFRRELPLALQAIRYGDRQLFSTYPALDYVPILVYFVSSYNYLNKVENWGSFWSYDIRNIGTL